MADKGDKQIQDQTQTQFGTQSNLFNTNKSGAQNPFAPAVGLLTKLAGNVGDVSTDVTAPQQTAANTLISGASAVPQFGSDAWNSVKRLFSTDTAPQIGMLNKSLGGLESNIGATARGANLDPMSTPGFSDALTTAMNDITNRVKGVYAGSGRDPSGAGSFAKSLGRGLTEGVSPTIAAEADRLRAEQAGAAKTLFDAGTGTAGQITSQGQVPLTNISQGMGLLPGVTNAFLAPGQAQAGAADAAYSLPIQNLMKVLAPALQIGGAGTTTSETGAGTSGGSTQSLGVGHGEVQQPQNLLSNILGGVSGGIGLLSLMSDERVKDDMAAIGKLNNGAKVYRFRYKGSPRVHIGLSAQEVERKKPQAVSEVGGIKMVDYDVATRDAA